MRQEHSKYWKKLWKCTQVWLGSRSVQHSRAYPAKTEVTVFKGSDHARLKIADRRRVLKLRSVLAVMVSLHGALLGPQRTRHDTDSDSWPQTDRKKQTRTSWRPEQAIRTKVWRWRCFIYLVPKAMMRCIIKDRNNFKFTFQLQMLYKMHLCWRNHCPTAGLVI